MVVQLYSGIVVSAVGCPPPAGQAQLAGQAEPAGAAARAAFARTEGGVFEDPGDVFYNATESEHYGALYDDELEDRSGGPLRPDILLQLVSLGQRHLTRTDDHTPAAGNLVERRRLRSQLDGPNVTLRDALRTSETFSPDKTRPGWSSKSALWRARPAVR